MGRQDRFYSVVDEPPELDQFHSMKRGMTTIREGEEKLLSTTGTLLIPPPPQYRRSDSNRGSLNAAPSTGSTVFGTGFPPPDY